MIISVITTFINILVWLIIIDALMSWIVPPRSNAFSRFIGVIIDPIVFPFRKLQEKFIKVPIPIDFSPLLAILFLQLMRGLIVGLLY